MNLCRIASLVGAFVTVAFGSSLAFGQDNVSGDWKTSEGVMTITQPGDQISGRYTSDHGEVLGKVQGQVLVGYWIEDHSDKKCATSKNGRSYWGQIQFTFAGDTFSGRWGYCDDPVSGNWTGTREAKPVFSVNGRWQTSEGLMTLVQQGDAVSGSYPQDRGEITGMMKGPVLEGYWIEDASGQKCAVEKNGRFYWGRIRFSFAKDVFAGTWGYCDNAIDRKWTGERVP